MWNWMKSGWLLESQKLRLLTWFIQFLSFLHPLPSIVTAELAKIRLSHWSKSSILSTALGIQAGLVVCKFGLSFGPKPECRIWMMLWCSIFHLMNFCPIDVCQQMFIHDHSHSPSNTFWPSRCHASTSASQASQPNVECIAMESYGIPRYFQTESNHSP